MLEEAYSIVWYGEKSLLWQENCGILVELWYTERSLVFSNKWGMVGRVRYGGRSVL